VAWVDYWVVENPRNMAVVSRLDSVVFVTSNDHKAEEVASILGIEVLRVSIDLPEIQSLSVEEVVILKAQAAFQVLGKPLVVEDTSLIIPALNGLPGPLVKWFLQTIAAEGIAAMLQPGKSRAATAQSCFGLVDETGKVELFLGEVTGEIALKPAGKTGFGWDSIFIPTGSTETFAEMGDQAKNKISHRYHALQKLRKYLYA